MVWLARYPEDARRSGQRASAHIRSFTPWSASQACIGGAMEDCYYKSTGISSSTVVENHLIALLCAALLQATSP